MHNLNYNDGPKLKDIWIMLGQSCDHRCRNCFEDTEKGIDKSKNNLNEKQIIKVIDDAIKLGINEVGIPGAGEPFHPENIKTLFKVLDYNFKRKIHTTIFTHTGFLNEDIVRKLNKYGNKITLLVKFNSFKPKIQDWFDNAPGYTKTRDKNLKLLFKYKFNDSKRLGFVTSIMNINYKEIPKIFKFCRDNNIIVDFDNLLPCGRGKDSEYHPSDKVLLNTYKKLSEIDKQEYNLNWKPTGAYIGEYSCNRYCHHLFIEKDGDIYPCIGARGILLGNIKKKSLKSIWNSKEMNYIKKRQYDGKCKECNSFKNRKCNSCLGRYTKNLITEDLLKTKNVHTIGCFAFEPIKN